MFEVPKKRSKDNARGAFLLMIPIETINGISLEKDTNKRHKKWFVVLNTFFNDHRFLAPSESIANDWRRLMAQQMVGRRKQATVRGRESKSRARDSGMFRLQDMAMGMASSLADADAGRNEELNALMALYLERRTGVLDELMRRELYKVREEANSMRALIEGELKRRRQK